jgi:diguanylate cyclase (GGDEF)-like protein
METLAASTLVSIAVLLRFYRLVREREEAEVALIFQADHDQLTGVANRFLLMRRLAAALNSDTGTAEGHVLAWVDLDGFKGINDRWGHSAGDEVIRTVARRLNCLVRASDTVARVGGDEFVVLCHSTSPWRAEELGLRICEAVGHGIEVGAVEVTVGASVGVVVAEPRTLRTTGGDLLLVDELLHRADLAMYEAKRAGGGVRIASAVSVAAS